MYWLFYSSHTSHHPSQTPCLPWISYVTQKLMLDSCKMPQKQSEAFHTFLWHFFQVKSTILLHIILQKCQIAFWNSPSVTSDFSRVYSSSCCSCWFEPEIIKVGHSSPKMYNNNIVNFQESTTILNAHTTKVYIYRMHLLFRLLKLNCNKMVQQKLSSAQCTKTHKNIS